MAALLPLITRDPVDGGELVVTRLESPRTGVVITGTFSLGWIGRLTPEQLDFVGLLLKSRNNVQKVANDLGVAYNTARSRLDEIVAALGGGPSEPDPNLQAKQELLDKLASREIDFDVAMSELKGMKGDRS
jgi:hypothetical protein